MFLFFFKQKTGYEMRISDWSSDVCSSDLKSLLIDFLSRVRFAQFDGRTRSVFCESTFFGRFRPCRFAGSAERTLPQRKLNDSSNTQHPGSKKIDRKSTRLDSVTNAHLVCRLLLDKKKNTMTNDDRRSHSY